MERHRQTEMSHDDHRARRRAWWVAPCLALVVGCSEQDMVKQPKIQRPYQESGFFADGQSSRPLVAGTVSRGQLRVDRAYYEGRSGEMLIYHIPAPPEDPEEAGEPGETPRKVDRAFLVRGQERFTIFCSPCHGRLGDGQGMIVKRGFSPPPSFHIDRLRDAPAGHFYHVITNGYGAMYSYASRVPVDDRWAIVAYIRALQLSQNARLEDVPADELAKLEGKER
ncbi:MAG: cytochrome c [Planctomycetaceae bacterium]|nr:cytochrome c [Planctomycetaceae bacterium]